MNHGFPRGLLAWWLAWAALPGCGASRAATPPGGPSAGSLVPDADVPSTPPAVADAAGPGESASPRTILPASRGRPPGLESEFVGDGTCRTDAECTVGRRAPCSFCGGCPQAMTQVEYDELGRQGRDCPPPEGPPPACSPCRVAVDRVVCVDGACLGVADPPGEQSFPDDGCREDADCVLVAFDGCCRCPASWTAHTGAWLDQAERFCAGQPCSAEAAAACRAPALPPGTRAVCARPGDWLGECSIEP
jgi:hypothetical protein